MAVDGRRSSRNPASRRSFAKQRHAWTVLGRSQKSVSDPVGKMLGLKKLSKLTQAARSEWMSNWR